MGPAPTGHDPLTTYAMVELRHTTTETPKDIWALRLYAAGMDVTLYRRRRLARLGYVQHGRVTADGLARIGKSDEANVTQ